MDRTAFRDPRIVDLVSSQFIPVKVDADRRPDVNGRYNLDGWPTTAVLTPTGEIMTGSTYLPPDALATMLEEGSAALRERYDELCARGAQAAAERRAAQRHVRYEPDGDAAAWLMSRIVDEHDAEHGGFGTGGKFLQASVLRFVLSMYERTRDAAIARVLSRTLEAICRGGHFDTVDGGFFRYVARRDFTRPHTEKLLEDQVAIIDVLLRAAVALDQPEYRERAVDAIRFVRRTLSDPDRGGFFASQKGDEEYYALNGSLRRSLDVPAVDITLFTDLNAQAVVAWLDAADALDDGHLARFAVQTADRVLPATFDQSEGHAHWLEADATGDLLGDQVHAAAAWLRLFRATGRPRDLNRGRAVIQIAIRRFWDPAAGGFFDRAPGGPDEIGMLADRRKPLALNSVAARVLTQLAAVTGESEWSVLARQALGAVTGTYRAHDLGAAPYALATLDVLTG
jgi:uncharacterized protein